MNNAQSLKARIRNLAKVKNLPAQAILQSFMLERFLVRLSKSKYKDKFILKGGILIAAVVGIDNRATMDLDATIKDLPLKKEIIEKVMKEICNIDSEDNVTISYKNASTIRKDDIYGGYRVMLSAKYDTILTSLPVDISTGDAITPHPITHRFSEILDSNKTFDLWTYNLETVMAEKSKLF